MAGGGFLRKMKCGLLVGVAALAIVALLVPGLAILAVGKTADVIGQTTIALIGLVAWPLLKFADGQLLEGFPGYARGNN